MIIREHPGKDEARSGRPFSGKTGREVSRFLDGVYVPRLEEMYATSWIKEWNGPDQEYAQEDYDRALADLATEVAAVHPDVILALGRGVTRLFLGDTDLETTHGIPWRLVGADEDRAQVRLWFDDPDAVVVVPIINPAAGFRSPELSAQSAYDFAQLAGCLSGEIAPRTLFADPIPAPVYRELLTVEEVHEVLNAATTFGTDTEGYPRRPWSVQLCSDAGTAVVIRHSRPDLIAAFAGRVNAHVDRYRFTFHSALHDLAVFRSLGVDTTRLQFDDTAIMAYNLQLEPRGLKPLCARHCNMRMMHFDDVMGDVSNQIAQDWLLCVQENEDVIHDARCHEEFRRLTTTPYTDAKGKVHSGRRLKVAPKLPKSDLLKAVERCLRSPHPRTLWGDQVVDRHVDAHVAYGPIWEATLDHVPLSRAIGYAARDADGTTRLAPELHIRLESNGLLPTYHADLGTVPLIDRMQRTGIRPDLQHFSGLSGDLQIELEAILERLLSRIADKQRVSAKGRDGAVDSTGSFNPNSTSHVGALLFERYSLDVLKRTPGGDPSTNDKVLEALEKDGHVPGAVRAIIADIREYRETYKLKHTFVDQIDDFVNRWPYDGRIHTTFRITGTVTGRLSASDPNLLAWPKHGKFAKRFRQGVVADAGHRICSWDLSQIELRVLAHLSQDPVLLHAFRNGIDLHATLAERIFGVPPSRQDKSQHRLPAKAVNFGIPMGMTKVGLCLELRKNGVDVDEDDAQRWLNETMALYKEVPVYQQGKIAQARRYGYVTDLNDRRRYIGGIGSFDQQIRSEAERFAFATPIQAGAQQVMKCAEAAIYNDILLPRWDAGEWVEPLIQIHDDLVIEVDEQLVPELNEQMVYAMTQIPADFLSVPIETSGESGYNWGDLKEIEEHS